MAIGVAELKRELRAAGGLTEFPEIHQFLDGFYLSRIGIRILIGQHIALHEPQKENHIGAHCLCVFAAGTLPASMPHSMRRRRRSIGRCTALLCAWWLVRKHLQAQAGPQVVWSNHKACSGSPW